MKNLSENKFKVLTTGILTVIMFTLYTPFASAQLGTKENPYPLEFYWKKKDGKIAVFCKSEITHEQQITDYLFDAGFKGSFDKGNKVSFISKSNHIQTADKNKKGEWRYINEIVGIVRVKIDGLYNVLSIRTSQYGSDESKILFSEGFDSWENALIDSPKTVEGKSLDTNCYAYVTRPGSPLKGLLKLQSHSGRGWNPIKLECEYDEIILADKANINRDGSIDVNQHLTPTFVIRKGNRWGAYEDYKGMVKAAYDRKSFTYTLPSMQHQYAVRSHGDMCFVERNDSVFIADREGHEIYYPGTAEALPTIETVNIPRYEGEYNPSQLQVIKVPGDLAAYSYEGDHFVPFKGSTSAIDIFQVSLVDDISTYLLTGSYGKILYNADKGKDLISSASSISLIPGMEGFLSVSFADKSTPKAAFITRDGSEAVLLNSMSDILSVAETVRTIGSAKILDYKGSVGLYNPTSGYILPCSYDSIMTVSEIIDSIPASIGNLLLSYKNKKFGISGSSASVMGRIFNKIERTNDRKGLIFKASIIASNPYKLQVTADENGSLVFEDNLDELFSDLIPRIRNKIKDNSAYTHYMDDALRGMMEVSAYTGKPELLSRIYEIGARQSINKALEVNEKRRAMEWLDKAGELYALAVAHSETELADLDIIGIRKRVAEYYRQQAIEQAEAEAARKLELERQAREQAEAQKLARQQRAEAWMQLATALGQMGQGINNAVSNYQASKARNRIVRRQTYTPSTTYSGSSSSSGSSLASSSTSKTTAKGNNLGNRKMLEVAYDTAKGVVMKYYYGKYTWDWASVQKSQQNMRDTRATAAKYGYNIHKSEFEDVKAPYRK